MLSADAGAMRSSVIGPRPGKESESEVRPEQAAGRDREWCDSAVPHAFGDPCVRSEKPPPQEPTTNDRGDAGEVRLFSPELSSRGLVRVPGPPSRAK